MEGSEFQSYWILVVFWCLLWWNLICPFFYCVAELLLHRIFLLILYRSSVSIFSKFVCSPILTTFHSTNNSYVPSLQSLDSLQNKGLWKRDLGAIPFLGKIWCIFSLSFSLMWFLTIILTSKNIYTYMYLEIALPPI